MERVGLSGGSLAALAIGTSAAALGAVGRIDLAIGEDVWPLVLALGITAFAVGAVTWAAGDGHGAAGLALGAAAVVLALWANFAADAKAERLEDESDRLEQELHERCSEIPPEMRGSVC